jgi:hypothetical protein
MILSIIWPKKIFIQVSSLTLHKPLKKEENFYCSVNENYELNIYISKSNSINGVYFENSDPIKRL